MFLPLLGLSLLLAFDLAEGSLSENTLAFLTSMVMALGTSLVILLGAFLLLMNNEVRKGASKLLRNYPSLTNHYAPTIYAVSQYLLQLRDWWTREPEVLFGGYRYHEGGYI